MPTIRCCEKLLAPTQKSTVGDGPSQHSVTAGCGNPSLANPRQCLVCIAKPLDSRSGNTYYRGRPFKQDSEDAPRSGQTIPLGILPYAYLCVPAKQPVFVANQEDPDMDMRVLTSVP
jgi:hypothetical protein